MKVRTLNRFREKDDYNVIHEVGSEFECSDERGNYLAGLRFVEIVKEAPIAEVKVEAKPAKENKKKVKPFVDETEDSVEGK